MGNLSIVYHLLSQEMFSTSVFLKVFQSNFYGRTQLQINVIAVASNPMPIASKEPIVRYT